MNLMVMKDYLSFCVLFISLFLLISCQNSDIVKMPDTDSHLSGHPMLIEQVELTDSATIFDVIFYHVPGFWWRVPKETFLYGNSTGKKYNLKFIEGLAPDVRVHVDSTGFLSARLFFDPLDPSDKIVDYIEENEGFLIKNIKLYNDNAGKIKTNISGNLNAFGVSWLILRIRDHYGSANNKTYIVPIKDGHFNFDLYTDFPRYSIIWIGKEILEGYAEHSVSFMSEGGKIIIDFHNLNGSDPEVKGGNLTSELIDFKNRERAFDDSINMIYPQIRHYIELSQSNKLYTPEFYAIQKRLSNSSNGAERLRLQKEISLLNQSEELLSQEGKEAINDYEKFMEKHKFLIRNKRRKFLEQESTKPTLAQLSNLYFEVLDEEDTDWALNLFNKNFRNYEFKHPYHDYLKEISEIISPSIGNHFINFKIKDTQGNTSTLKDLIKDKTGLLIFTQNENDVKQENLNFLPALYDKYKDKGLEILVISDLEKSQIESPPLPASFPKRIMTDWEQEDIKYKYYLEDSVQKIFLIDRDGLIIAVNPTLKQIEDYLHKNPL